MAPKSKSLNTVAEAKSAGLSPLTSFYKWKEKWKAEKNRENCKEEARTSTKLKAKSNVNILITDAAPESKAKLSKNHGDVKSLTKVQLCDILLSKYQTLRKR